MIPALKPSDQIARTNVAVDMLERIDVSPDFLHQVCFSDEVMFHVTGVVNRYNCRIWVSQNPHVTCELERGNPKVNCVGRPNERQVQEDGSLPHFCDHVGNHLDREMVRRRISRGGPITWPPRLTDLTPLDFFLWSYVKDIVYQVKINDRQHLKARIRDSVAMGTPNMFQAMWNEHLNICRAMKGAHIEIY
jgi:hypothetical protein